MPLTAPKTDAAADSVRSKVAAAYGLTPLQAGMLFEILMSADPTEYVLQEAQFADGRLEPALTEVALAALVRRHDAMRTLILHEGLAEPRQVVLTARRPDFRAVEAADEAAVAELARQDRARGFDLQRDPLIRVTHAQLADGRTALVWTVHHIVADDWSAALAFRHFAAYYEAAAAGATREQLEARAAEERGALRLVAGAPAQDGEANPTASGRAARLHRLGERGQFFR
ncbi:MAG: condensation domain-containing protein, partial [Bifidobacteriaceae bacterium]|nr:condensation domain-containing protein [Bifidobacteriaceae bacterium]